MQLHQEKETITEFNTKVLAVSVDGPVNASLMKEKTGVQVDILCDEDLNVIKMYDLVDDDLMPWDIIDGKASQENGQRQIALCANILINQEGYVTSQWQGHYNYRPSHEETIKILSNM